MRLTSTTRTNNRFELYVAGVMADGCLTLYTSNSCIKSSGDIMVVGKISALASRTSAFLGRLSHSICQETLPSQRLTVKPGMHEVQ